MGQQVEFAKIPETEPERYQSVVTSLLAFVQRENPTPKELRRHMRTNSTLDKDTAELLFEFLGLVVVKGKPVQVTGIGKTLLDLDDSDEWKLALFNYLASLNEILVKYVFDALYERLYSVNEMYRVLTSYVYPGKHVSLISFKNWMKWLEATGTIKYIGIRWGPSPMAKEIEDYLRGIDIEEILEEEAEEEADDWDPDFSEDLPPLPEDATAEAGPVTEGDAESSVEEPDQPPEPELPDQPPAPEVSPAASAATPKRQAAPAAVAVAAPATQAPMPVFQYGLQLRAVSEIQEVAKALALDSDGDERMRRAAGIDEAEIAQNLEGIRDWWRTDTELAPIGFRDFGLNPDDYRADKEGARSFFLYRALVAATCELRPPRTTGGFRGAPLTSFERFETLNDSGALSRHFLEGQPIDEVLAALVASGHAARLEILELMPYLALARQALSGTDDWAQEQSSAEPEAIWKEVYERLNAGVFTLELIWLVREMSRGELWAQEGLAPYRVVPTQSAMDVAFRLGLVETPYLGSFAAALSASQRLTGLFGDAFGYEAGILHFGRRMGCAFDCSRRNECTYFCREKLRR